MRDENSAVVFVKSDEASGSSGRRRSSVGSHTLTAAVNAAPRIGIISGDDGAMGASREVSHDVGQWFFC